MMFHRASSICTLGVRRCLIWVLGFCTGMLPSLAATQAQTATPPNPAATSPGTAMSSQRLAPPPLPTGKAPVQFFRELLAMSAAERDRLLQDRPAESRKIILSKLQEYEALTPENRELRLRVTELRYFLRPLMSVVPQARAALLERVPEALRPMIDERLERWDALPAEKQQELLESEDWIRQMAEFGWNSPQQQASALTNMPASQRQSLESAAAKWHKFSEDRKQEIAQRFEEFYGLQAQQRDRILLNFPQEERQQMERTLKAFDKLPPAKRAECVRALDKLAGLTPRERALFLASAERWQTLSPAERKAWRNLVFNLSLPPKPTVPLPPRPPDASRASLINSSYGTNLVGLTNR